MKPKANRIIVIDRQRIETPSPILTGIPHIKPTFLYMVPGWIPPNIIPYSKGVKRGLIHARFPLS